MCLNVSLETYIFINCMNTDCENLEGMSWLYFKVWHCPLWTLRMTLLLLLVKTSKSKCVSCRKYQLRALLDHSNKQDFFFFSVSLFFSCFFLVFFLSRHEPENNTGNCLGAGTQIWQHSEQTKQANHLTYTHLSKSIGIKDLNPQSSSRHKGNKRLADSLSLIWC